MTDSSVHLNYDGPRDEWTLTLDDGIGGRQSVVLPPGIVETMRGQFIAGAGVVPMDDTTARFIEMARHLEAQEPERPDLDRHTGHHLEAVARAWDAWDRQRGAYYLLIGSRLTRNALRGP
jgi:hypothetical protein